MSTHLAVCLLLIIAGVTLICAIMHDIHEAKEADKRADEDYLKQRRNDEARSAAKDFLRQIDKESKINSL